MPLSQDKYRQINHKIHASQFPLGKETLKQFLNGDPRELWYIETPEDKESESGNDSELEKEKSSAAAAACNSKSHFKCEERHYVDGEESEYKGSEYSDENRYYEAKRDWSGEYCCHACVCRQLCGKTRSGRECGSADKPWRKNPDEFDRRAKTKGCVEHASNRPRQTDCEEKHQCGQTRYQSDRTERIPVHQLMYSKPFKNVHQSRKSKPVEDQIYRSASKPECCHYTKKILDSYEELPAVDESLEQLSERTYKTSSYTNFPNVGECPSTVAKNGDNVKDVYARTPSWVLCDKDSPLNDVLPHGVYPERSRKARSRRTRMNRSRFIKWKRALIHPVVEGSRKEMVGMMVWGQKGPEYYSKLTGKKACLPFRKSRSFPEDQTKSDDISFNFEQKDVFFAASDPGQKPRSKPKTPEEDGKIEEKIAKFDKNLEELVNRTNEKFLRTLSEQSNGEKFDAPKKENETGTDNAKKKPQLMPSELLSSRAPKMDRTGRDIFAFNVESKTMAEALNEKAKQYRLSQLTKEENAPALEKKYPPKELDKETKDANLSLWGMKQNEELKETAGGEGDGNELSLHLRIPPRLTAELNECELHPKRKETKPEMEKLSDEMHRERRRKYYMQDNRGEAPEKESDKMKAAPEHEQILFDIFKNLVKEGCAISEKESENLQKILHSMRYEAGVNDPTTSEVDSKTSEETIRKDKRDDCQSDGISKKLLKLKPTDDDRKKLRRDLKGKKRHPNVEKIKLKMIRSMAAENEAAHLKQLKKYIRRFIDGVELKISSPESRRRRRKAKTTSSESSEVRVDAQRVIDLVSNPFKRITSDVTIDMARKLTDALVQESKTPKNSSKNRKNSDDTEDASLPCPTTSGSDRDEEPEPTYLEGLKKMRNDHLSNIMTEVKRLKELIRFLDRCNRLKL